MDTNMDTRIIKDMEDKMETIRYTRNLPEEEFMAIMDVLNAFDRHKDGSINQNDLPLVMQSLSKKINLTEFKELERLADIQYKFLHRSAFNEHCSDGFNNHCSFSEVFKLLAKWDAWMLERQEDGQKIEKSTEFTEAEETFKKFAKNGKVMSQTYGPKRLMVIKCSKLLSVLQSSGKEVTSAELKYLIHCIKDEDDYGWIKDEDGENKEDGEQDLEDEEDGKQDGVFGFSEFFKVLRILDRDPAQQDGGHLDDKEIRALFRTLDVDGTGIIAKFKLDQIAGLLAPEYWSQTSWYPLDLLDVNENGQIDYEEFIPVIKLVDTKLVDYEFLRYGRKIPEEEFMAIMDVLNAFDRHKVGKISQNHLPLVMQSLSEKLNKTQLWALKYMVDVEHQAVITFSEVFKVLAKWDAWMLETQEDIQKIEKSAEFTEALETFKKLDENGKGTMKSTELPSLLQSAGKEVTSTELKYLIHYIKDEDDYEEDGEHDGEDGEVGVFGFSEFFKVLSILDRDPAQQDGGHLEDKEIRALFRNVDVDGTGFIAKGKLDQIARAFAPKYWYNTYPYNTEWYPLDLLDVNENGQIDYEEFIPVIKLVDKSQKDQ